MRIEVYFFIILLGLTVSCSKKVDKPNVILIMADDLGWGDTGYNGSSIIKTPHLDKMASEGIQFNRFYSGSSVCSPTRASVLTGRNPYRSGVFDANVGILRPEEVTIAEVLKKEGYATGHFGKWHLGTLTTKHKDANRGGVDNLKEYNPPKLHGYDVAYVTESKVPTYDPMIKPVNRYKKRGWDYIKKGEAFKAFGTAYWDIDGNMVKDDLSGDDSKLIVDWTLPFIKKNVEEENPFLAVVWFHAPHKPCVAGPRHAAMYEDQPSDMKNYAGCVTAMDEQIGRLRSKLKEYGVDKNTMIFFCSDNGPEVGNPGSAGDFRDRKRSLHEGGVRVPGLMVWPAMIKQPFQTDFPAVTSDYLPTIADYLNIGKDVLKNKIDGESLMGLIKGESDKRVKPISICYENQMSFSDNQYKIYALDGKPSYYDIANDPFEKNEIEETDDLRHLYMQMDSIRVSLKRSFDGNEYGQASFNKLEQKWSDPFKFIQTKKWRWQDLK